MFHIVLVMEGRVDKLKGKYNQKLDDIEVLRGEAVDIMSVLQNLYGELNDLKDYQLELTRKKLTRIFSHFS